MTIRNANATKEKIIQAAFEEIHANGFRATSMNEIVKRAGITKGALYHHFESKTELGYAVIDQVLRPMMQERWLKPLGENENPIDALIDCMDNLIKATPKQAVIKGCPVANLAHEMSGIDEGFRLKLAEVLKIWQDGLSKVFSEGIEKGYVRHDVNTDNVACFLVASIEGAIGLAKNSKDENTFNRCGQQLIIYLESLRANQGDQIKSSTVS